MEVYKLLTINKEHITKFHSEEYVEFLSTVSSDSFKENQMLFGVCNLDCPVFDGLFDFCKASAGGSIGAAERLRRRDADIAINWAGGLHHAKKCEASDFCYVNDIVLAKLELLKGFRRVLYVDIDVHHGDGVEEAFYHTNRVMTVSFREFDPDDFFPMSGYINQAGVGVGKDCALNVPLRPGINDKCFSDLFGFVIKKVMEVYFPEAIVLQSGADSLVDDPLGDFNLTTKGHASCLSLPRTYNIPLLLLGGGGYDPKNVARCWCFETSVALDVPIDNHLPENDFSQYFKSQLLHIQAGPIVNKNTRQYTDNIKRTISEQLRRLEPAPNVGYSSSYSEGSESSESSEKREEDMDRRNSGARLWNGEDIIDRDDDGNPVR